MLPVSIKIRPIGGCYHREHSPCAYRIIDKYLLENKLDVNIHYTEHESGPEIIVSLALLSAEIGLVKSIIDFIVTVIKARSEGITQGDDRHSSLELIVRKTDKTAKEEVILKINSMDPLDKKIIEKGLLSAIENMYKEKQV